MDIDVDAQLVMMVAQEPFETQDLNRFCKLMPVVFDDGTQPVASDFRNDGEVWWMLTPQTSPVAKPGMLLVGKLEKAYRYDEDDPTSSHVQVVRDSIRELTQKEGLSIVDIPATKISVIEEVVSQKFRVNIPLLQSSTVLIRWRSQIYGPFNLTPDIRASGSQAGAYSLSVSNVTDMTIYQLEASQLQDVSPEFLVSKTYKVSLSAQHRSRGVALQDVKCNLLLAQGFEQLIRSGARRMVLESGDRKLLRYAKQCLTRTKRQQLQALLEEINLHADEVDKPDELRTTLELFHTNGRDIETALDAVAKALLESGMLGEDRISRAEKEYAEKYVAEKAAEVQAKVEDAITQKKKDLVSTETALKEVQRKLQKEEAVSKESLKRELDEMRERAQKAIRKEKDEFQLQKDELQRQQSLLHQNLSKVTKELREAGDDVVNRFLTIAPLLGSYSQARESVSVTKLQPSDKEPATKIDFHLPEYINGCLSDSGETISEMAFFERFCKTVAESGFSYRPLDLQRFHLSVKCGDLTVLGGASGTGKSSLPALYANALRGELGQVARPGCLMVNVNPSWMDARDLLGHLNTIEGRFFPSESGLYQYLVCAQEENRAKNSATGLYLACLDEMNLSQIEHYFSDFMMALERKGNERVINCFSPETAGLNCPFRNWGSIALSPALRFVGTVNFDETTRSLSDRFLDRANLIMLNSSALPTVAAPTGGFAPVMGKMVSLSDYESWISDKALPAELAAILDQMRPLLEQLKCPLSPRVYRSICRFVASASPVMNAVKAFDIQVVQRLLPRIRCILTEKQRNALDELSNLLRQSSVCTFEETITSLDQILESARAREWDVGE